MEQEQKVTLTQEETEGTLESGLGEGPSPWEQQGYSPLDSTTEDGGLVFHPAAAFGGSDSEDSEGEGDDNDRRKARNPSFSDDFVAMGPSAAAVDVDAIAERMLSALEADYQATINSERQRLSEREGGVSQVTASLRQGLKLAPPSKHSAESSESSVLTESATDTSCQESDACVKGGSAPCVPSVSVESTPVVVSGRRGTKRTDSRTSDVPVPEPPLSAVEEEAIKAAMAGITFNPNNIPTWAKRMDWSNVSGLKEVINTHLPHTQPTHSAETSETRK